MRKQWGDKVIVWEVDVDVPENRQPVYYHIQSVPTLMLFRQGKVLWDNMQGLSEQFDYRK